MVKPLQHRPQSLGEFNISAGSNTVFQQKAQNLAALNNIGQELTDPIAEAILSGEAEADRLAKYELERDLPVEEIPEAEGGFNPFHLTKWGKTYQKSYNDLDAQLIGLEADKALRSAAIELLDPSRQGPGMTAAYAERAAQIREAYTNAATPGNRTRVMTALSADANNYEFTLAQKEQQYNHEQVVSKVSELIKEKERMLQDAIRSQDHMLILKLSNDLESIGNDATNLNIFTHAQNESFKKAIASNGKTSLIAAQWYEADKRGEGPAFLKEVATNPERFNLTVGETESLIKNIVHIKQVKESATSDYYALQGAQVEADMAKSLITSKTDLLDYDLNDMQMLKYEAAIDRASGRDFESTQKLNNARELIKSGQSAGIDKSIISKMTDNAWAGAEEALGRPLTLIEKAQSVAGDLGAYNASGLPGIGLGTNDPTLDKIVSASLTSTDPAAMVQGAQAYQYMAITKGQPNSIKLEGDAQRVAILMNSLIQGNVAPHIAAQRAIDTVINKSDSAMAFKLSQFESSNIQDRLEGSFKSTFGVESDLNPQAFGMFIDQVRVNYVNGLDYGDSVKATKLNMADLQESKYFPKGVIGKLAPETLPTIANEFDNQFAASVQNLINKGATGVGLVPIQWANHSDAIDLSKLNPDELIDTPLSAVIGGKLPEIKIGNHKSKVYIIAGERARFGDNARPIYQLGYMDEFGILQPIADEGGVNSAATFSPQPIEVFAPNFTKNYSAKKRREAIKAASEQPLHQATGNLARILSAPVHASLFQSKELQKIYDEYKNAPELGKEIEKDLNDYFNEGEQP